MHVFLTQLKVISRTRPIGILEIFGVLGNVQLLPYQVTVIFEIAPLYSSEAREAGISKESEANPCTIQERGVQREVKKATLYESEQGGEEPTTSCDQQEGRLPILHEGLLQVWGVLSELSPNRCHPRRDRLQGR